MTSSRPVEVSDSTHHGGWIMIITVVGLLLVIFCLLLRIYARVTYSRIAGLPDYCLMVAATVAIAQSCLVIWEVRQGLGTSIELVSHHQIQHLQKSSFASDVLYLLGIYCSKCFICVLYLQLTLSKSHNRASYALLALSTVWAVASLLTIGIDCELNQPWSNLASQCTDMFARWLIVTVFDVIIELALFALAIYLISGLRMPLQRKSFIVVAFGLRLFLIIPAICRFRYLAHQIHSSDPTLAAAGTVIWTGIELNMSVVACICYCFKAFAAAVSTNYGGVAINIEVYESTNNRIDGLPSHWLWEGIPNPFANNSGTTEATITSGARSNTKSSTKTSDSSEKAVIVKEVRVEQTSRL